MLDGRYWNIIVYPTSAKNRKEFWTQVWEEKVVRGSNVGISTILLVTHTVSGVGIASTLYRNHSSLMI